MDKAVDELDLEQLLRESEGIEVQLAHSLAQQRTFTQRLAAALKAALEALPRQRLASEAFHRFPLISDQLMRKICRAHAVGTGVDNEFALKQTTDGPWHVLEPEFSIFADRVNRGLAQFRSSKS